MLRYDQKLMGPCSLLVLLSGLGCGRFFLTIAWGGGDSSRAEPTSTSGCVVESLHFEQARHGVLFNDHLGDAVTFIHLKVDLTVVEKEHLDFTTVVSIDNSCPDMDGVLDSEARPGGNPGVVADRNSKGQAKPNQGLASSRNDLLLRGV